MTESDKAVMQQALAALEGVLDDDKDVLKASISGGLYEVVDCQRSIASLRAAIAQSEQPADHRAPVAFLCHGNLYMWPAEDDYCGNPEDHIPLYTIPHPAIAQPTIKESLTVQTIAQPEQTSPVRQPLTDDDIEKCVEKVWGSFAEFDEVRMFTRAIESAHGIAQPKDKP